MSKGYKQPCGCRCTDSEWIEMCPAHEAEWQEVHARWRAEHEATRRDQDDGSNKRGSYARRKPNNST